MSIDPAPVREDDLAAFVDARLDAGRRADVAAYLEAHPDLAAAVEKDLQLRAALRARLAGIVEEPVPARLRIAALRAGQRAQARRRLEAVAAALVLLMVGAGGGFWAGRIQPGPAAPGAAMQVARDATAAYRTFVVEVAHPVEVDTSREAHLLQWLSKRLGRPLTAPDLTRFGYRLMGGRLLPADAGAAAQLMYEDKSGQRLTLYVQAASGSETAFRFRQEGEAGTFVWIDQGFGFAVTGPAGRDALLPIAEAVYQSFEAVRPLPRQNGA